MPTDYSIYAPDLPASLHWYSAVLGCLPLPGAATPTYQLGPGYQLRLVAEGAIREFTLLVEHLPVYRHRFEQRPTFNGENQGRLLESRPDTLVLVDPAGNLLRLMEAPHGPAATVEMAC